MNLKKTADRIRLFFQAARDILKSSRIGRPLPADVLIFDSAASDVLEKTVLQDIEFAVLHVMPPRLYLSPQLLSRMLCNCSPADFRSYRSAGRATGLRKLAGYLYRNYLLACVQTIRPRIVLTLVDDSPFFHYVSRRYPQGRFCAITNGIRFQKPVIPGADDYVISMPELVCYGRFEADFLEGLGHRIDRYHPLGGLIAGYYLERIAPRENIEKRYDICLVSQFVPQVANPDVDGEVAEATAIQDRFLERYLEENDLRCCIALRGESDVENDHFRGIYGDRADRIQNKRLSFSTYKAMHRSDVVVAFHSSAALDAYGWGEKVLFTNFTGNANCRIPVHEFCMVEDKDYAIFKEKLSEVLNMGKDRYHEITWRNRHYVYSLDNSAPAHRFVRECVQRALP
jgi:hypothetical protein